MQRRLLTKDYRSEIPHLHVFSFAELPAFACNAWASFTLYGSSFTGCSMYALQMRASWGNWTTLLCGQLWALMNFLTRFLFELEINLVIEYLKIHIKYFTVSIRRIQDKFNQIKLMNSSACSLWILIVVPMLIATGFLLFIHIICFIFMLCHYWQ